MKILTLAFLTLAATFSIAHAEDPSPVSIKNYGVVETGIYRGGAPGDEGLQYLNSIHVKTILD